MSSEAPQQLRPLGVLQNELRVGRCIGIGLGAFGLAMFGDATLHELLMRKDQISSRAEDCKMVELVRIKYSYS